jgi:hypothetical protein
MRSGWASIEHLSNISVQGYRFVNLLGVALSPYTASKANTVIPETNTATGTTPSYKQGILFSNVCKHSDSRLNKLLLLMNRLLVRRLFSKIHEYINRAAKVFAHCETAIMQSFRGVWYRAENFHNRPVKYWILLLNERFAVAVMLLTRIQDVLGSNASRRKGTVTRSSRDSCLPSVS